MDEIKMDVNVFANYVMKNAAAESILGRTMRVKSQKMCQCDIVRFEKEIDGVVVMQDDICEKCGKPWRTSPTPTVQRNEVMKKTNYHETTKIIWAWNCPDCGEYHESDEKPHSGMQIKCIKCFEEFELVKPKHDED